MQLHISNSFFLGSAYVLLRSINGKNHGLNIVDNMFSGDASGVPIVQLDKWKRPFRSIKLVIVDRNEVYGGMEIKSTLAKVFLQGHGKRWSYDFSPVLLFHDRIRHVEYSLQVDGSFPHHAFYAMFRVTALLLNQTQRCKLLCTFQWTKVSDCLF